MFRIYVFASALLFAVSAGRAQPAEPSAPLSPPIERWTLANGLEVAVAITDRSPALAVQVWYRVGSKDEPAGKRGTAHMFEHLMFKGSNRVAPDAHTRYLRLAGGYSNAITTEDGTAYHNTVPHNRLEFTLELEADRMRGLVFQPKTVEAQKEIVRREIERNLRNPLYAAVVQFLPVVFGSHPYAWTSAGVASEVEKINAAELAAFYSSFYTPNNALIVVVGNVTRKEVEPLIERHFGKIERGAEVPRPNPPPAQKATIRTVGKSLGKLGFIISGYRIPAAADKDIYALQLLSLILSRGEDSRLYRKLVEAKLAVEAGGQAIVREQLGVFMVFGAFTKASDSPKVEQALADEIAAVRDIGVKPPELASAAEQARAALGFSVQSIDGLAQQIGTAWSLTGDPGHFTGDLEKFAAVTVADIKAVAEKYFTAENRVVVELPIATPAKGIKP